MGEHISLCVVAELAHAYSKQLLLARSSKFWVLNNRKPRYVAVFLEILENLDCNRRRIDVF